LVVIGEGGQLCVTDQGYDLFDASGRIIDRREPAGGASNTYADRIADQWCGLLAAESFGTASTGMAEGSESEGRPSPATILACCQACLLSSRTGQPESPAKLVAIGG
jgi:hypothetical protein